MLGIKETLTKLLTMKPIFEYVGDYGQTIFSSTWTAPDDGLIVLAAQWNNTGTGGYWYVKDSTANIEVCYLSTITTNSYRNSSAFPVIKGHQYTTSMTSSVATANAKFYKLTWGSN